MFTSARYRESRLMIYCVESQFLSTKGAKCESPGQRPRSGSISFEALKARNYVVSTEYSNDYAASNIISRLQRSEAIHERTWADGPGFRISRPWLLEPEF
jgi:hypothetical protein